MATQTEIDYALMAGYAYRDTRADINRFPIPQGWMEKVDTLTGTNTTDRINGYGGNDRMLWRLIAANDAAIQAWRAAA